MDYKEEYQKALERAKKGLPIDEVFPELKASEDERIRKFLVELVSNDKANNYNGLYNDRGVRFDDVLAYLEKQKEPKPEIAFPNVSDISEEELIAEYADVLYKTIQHYVDGDVDFTDFNVKADAEINFFHLRRRLSKALDNRYNDGYQEGIASYKPSEEQMEALEWMLTTVSMKDGGKGVVLKNLINELKKQM